MRWICTAIKNGSSETHIVGYTKFLIPSLSKVMAGSSNIKSKQIKTPKFVVKVIISGFGGLYFPYLKQIIINFKQKYLSSERNSLSNQYSISIEHWRCVINKVTITNCNQIKYNVCLRLSSDTCNITPHPMIGL